MVLYCYYGVGQFSRKIREKRALGAMNHYAENDNRWATFLLLTVVRSEHSCSDCSVELYELYDWVKVP